MAAGTKAATETQAEHKPGFPPFEPEHFPSQLLWLAITFVAIYVFVSRVIIKRVGGTIPARAARIPPDLHEPPPPKAPAPPATPPPPNSPAHAPDQPPGTAR